MPDDRVRVRQIIPEQVVLARLAQSEQMREFFIQMWKQNPALARQGGSKVKNLMSPLEYDDTRTAGSPPGSGSVKIGNSQRGVSLVELIMFIVIVSVALAGVLLVMNVTGRSSADPLIHKQSLAIAESLLEEVELMPFTICDPDDGSAASAVVAADCGTVAPAIGAEVQGVENDVSRYDPTFPFDNVSDYHGFAMSGAGGIRDITNTPISAALDGYSANVAVAAVDFGGITAASGDALQITVTVTGPGGTPVVVDGVRTRYAPRTTP